MAEIGIEVERDAVIAHPMANPDADRADLALVAAALGDPDADAPRPPLAGEVEGGERPDQPLLERPDIAVQIEAAALQIEHDIADALARSVIGELPAAAGLEHRKEVGRDEILGPRAGARRVERRVFQQPDQLRRGAGADRGDALLHPPHRRLIGDRRVVDLPFDGCGVVSHAACYEPGDLVLSRAISGGRSIGAPRRRGRGGIGRRAALRSLWGKPRGSSSLLDRTIPPYMLRSTEIAASLGFPQ